MWFERWLVNARRRLPHGERPQARYRARARAVHTARRAQQTRAGFGWAGAISPRRILGPVLVIQERRRFYRESMTVFLRSQLRTTEVIDGVADADELLAAAAEGPLDHAVIEADGVPWDVCALVASLRARHRDIRLIGLTVSSRPSPMDGLDLLPRRATPDQVVKLVEPDVDGATPFVLSVATGNGNGPSRTNSYASSLCSASASPHRLSPPASVCPSGASPSRRWRYSQSSTLRARPRPSPLRWPVACWASPLA